MARNGYISARRLHMAVFLVFVVWGFLIYSNTFNVPRHYDDRHVFADSTLQQILNKCTLKGGGTRVVAELTFAFNYWLSGPKVLSYHIVNLVIHVCTAFLVYQLLFQVICLSRGNKASGEYAPQARTGARLFPPLNDALFWSALFAGLIFLVHPLATQAVTYISQRYTSLATLFFVASIVCYLKARSVILCQSAHTFASWSSFFSINHLAWYTLCVLTATLAMLTKEMALTLPVVIVLIEFLFVQHDFKSLGRRAIYLLPFLMTGLIIPYAHVVVLKASNLDAITELVSDIDRFLPRWASEQLSRETYFFSQIGIIWGIYLRLLVWPWGQNIEHDFHVSSSLLDHTTLIASLGIVGLTALAVWTYRRYRLIAFGILWFFVTLAVTSSIIPNKIFVAEHRAYLPMIGLAFVTAGIYRYLRRPRMFWTILVSITVLLSILTFMRNRVWKDELSLWGDALKKSPGLSRPYNNYADALKKAGRLDEAITLYKRALAMPYVPLKTGAGHDLIALNNLGNIYVEKGMYEEALKYYQAVIEQAPDSALDVYFNMGNLFVELRQYGNAIQAYQKALEVDPQDVDAYTNLGGVWMALQMYDDAEAALKKAVQLSPEGAEAYLSLGSLYSLDPMKRKKAVTNYKRYLALKPDTPLREKVLEKIRRLEGGFN